MISSEAGESDSWSVRHGEVDLALRLIQDQEI